MRADNADLRLTQRGVDAGIVTDPLRAAVAAARSEALEEALAVREGVFLRPFFCACAGLLYLL